MKNDQRAQAAGEPADGWRQPDSGLHERSRHGRVEKFHRNGQPQCGGGGSFAQRLKDFLCPGEDYPEAAIRDGADELTLRAGEVKTLKACINVDHIEGKKKGDRRWLMRTGMPSAKRFTMELKGVTGKSCGVTTERFCRAAGAEQPSESQKAKALWAMKAVKDREEDFLIQLAKRTFWEGNRQDWSCGKSVSKTQS